MEAFPVKRQGNGGNALVKRSRGVGELRDFLELAGSLLRQIKGGELKAMKDRGWKIRRSELEHV